MWSYILAVHFLWGGGIIRTCMHNNMKQNVLKLESKNIQIFLSLLISCFAVFKCSYY